jgi:tetratricopeptide (TPR) repeat protein
VNRTLVALLALSPVLVAARKPPPPAWEAGPAAAADYAAGMAAVQNARWPEAEKSFRAALAKEPDCGLCLVGLGRVLVSTSRSAEAIEPLQKAQVGWGNEVDTHLWAGRALNGASRWDDALAAARAGLWLKPGSADLQRVAQQALREKKDWSAAHAMLADARKAANLVAFDCMEGVVEAAEGNVTAAKERRHRCEGIPDKALLAELDAAIAGAGG